MLNRRSTRSLRAFFDEVSEVMQFHVRKLYTAEGRRVRSDLYFNEATLIYILHWAQKTVLTLLNFFSD